MDWPGNRREDDVRRDTEALVVWTEDGGNRLSVQAWHPEPLTSGLKLITFIESGRSLSRENVYYTLSNSTENTLSWIQSVGEKTFVTKD